MRLTFRGVLGRCGGEWDHAREAHCVAWGGSSRVSWAGADFGDPMGAKKECPFSTGLWRGSWFPEISCVCGAGFSLKRVFLWFGKDTPSPSPNDFHEGSWGFSRGNCSFPACLGACFWPLLLYRRLCGQQLPYYHCIEMWVPGFESYADPRSAKSTITG